MLLSRGELEELLGGAKAEPVRILDVEIVNYTPLMLGDYRGYHFAQRGKGPGFEATAGLYAQAIRGKARWLARVVFASLEGCGCSTYTCVEKKCFPVTLPADDKQQKPARVGLIELLYGRVGDVSIASLFNVVTVVDYGALRKAEPWVPPLHPKFADTGQRYGFDRYSALLARGTKDDSVREQKKPQPPGAAKLRLVVVTRPGAERLLREARAEGCRLHLGKLAAFYAATALAAPTLLGIGKAANRGFGRFKIEKVNADIDELGGLLETLQGLQAARDERTAANALQGVLREITRLAAEAACSQPGQPGLTLIPRLVNAYSPPAGVNARAIVLRTRASSLDEAIEFIGAAVLKQKWKASNRNPRGSGLNYHTWPLGLPRGSVIDCKCRSHAKPLKKAQRFGYLVLHGSNLQGPVECLPHSRCAQVSGLSSDMLPDVAVTTPSGRSVKAKDVRRQSMYVVFPLPGGHAGGVLVAVIPLISLDMNLGVDGNLNGLRDYKLIHMGGHSIPGDKPPPCCSGHVVDVAEALRRTQVPPGRQPRGTCGCGSDPGGVAEPRGGLKTPAGFLDAVNAAYEWLQHCLRQMRPWAQRTSRGYQPDVTC